MARPNFVNIDAGLEPQRFRRGGGTFCFRRAHSRMERSLQARHTWLCATHDISYNSRAHVIMCNRRTRTTYFQLSRHFARVSVPRCTHVLASRTYMLYALTCTHDHVYTQATDRSLLILLMACHPRQKRWIGRWPGALQTPRATPEEGCRKVDASSRKSFPNSL